MEINGTFTSYKMCLKRKIHFRYLITTIFILYLFDPVPLIIDLVSHKNVDVHTLSNLYNHVSLS